MNNNHRAPVPGNAQRQEFVDRLADINLDLAHLTGDIAHQRLNNNDPIYLVAQQLLRNSADALKLAASSLAAEQARRRQP